MTTNSKYDLKAIRSRFTQATYNAIEIDWNEEPFVDRLLFSTTVPGLLLQNLLTRLPVSCQWCHWGEMIEGFIPQGSVSIGYDAYGYNEFLHVFVDLDNADPSAAESLDEMVASCFTPCPDYSFDLRDPDCFEQLATILARYGVTLDLEGLA